MNGELVAADRTPLVGRASGSALVAGQHATKGAAADDVQVEVIDFLPAMRAGIGDHAEPLAISTSRDAALGAYPPCGADKVHDLLIAGFGGELFDIPLVSRSDSR